MTCRSTVEIFEPASTWADTPIPPLKFIEEMAGKGNKICQKLIPKLKLFLSKFYSIIHTQVIDESSPKQIKHKLVSKYSACSSTSIEKTLAPHIYQRVIFYIVHDMILHR
jgi:hypothetical protein